MPEDAHRMRSATRSAIQPRCLCGEPWPCRYAVTDPMPSWTWDWKPDVRPDRQHICSSCWDAADKTACPECDTLYLIGTCPECGGGQ